MRSIVCPEPAMSFEEIVQWATWSSEQRALHAKSNKGSMLIVDLPGEDGQPQTLLREELYEKVFAQQACDLARELGVTEHVFAGVCRALKIPKPGRGYWTKVKNGYQPTRPALPASDGPIGVGFRRLDPRDLMGAALVERFEQLRNRLQDPENPTDGVPGIDVGRCHPLVCRTAALLETARPDSFGRLQPEGTEACLDLRVCRKTLPRALGVAEALVRVFEALGCAVHTRRVHEGRMETTVGILGAHVPWSIFEQSLVQAPAEASSSHARAGTNLGQRDDAHYRPEGWLELKMNPNLRGQVRIGKRSWRDGSPKHRVESMLTEFVAAVIEAALLILCAKRLLHLKREFARA